MGIASNVGQHANQEISAGGEQQLAVEERGLAARQAIVGYERVVTMLRFTRRHSVIGNNLRARS